MASSSSLILLPPRQTAQAPQNWVKSSASASSDDSFAPKLEKAKRAKTAAKHQAVTATATKPTAAKSATTKPSAVDDDQTPKAKTANPKNPADADAAAQDESATADAETAEKTATPAATLQAQATQAAEKKPVKIKTPAKALATPGRQHPATAVQPTKQNPAATGTNDSTDATDPDAEGDGNDAVDPTVRFGSGFYGSANVVARGVAGKAEEDTATTENADAAESTDATATAAAGQDAVATVEAEVAAAPTVGKSAGSSDARPDTAAVLNALGTSSTPSAAGAGKTSATAASPQANFAEENHPKIVDSIQGQLLPKGGTMQLQLHPAELGNMQVTVQMKDGVMTASFQTSNDNATKLLTRSLGQLKSGLEAAGVSVAKLQVEQAPQDSKSDSDSGSKQSSQDQQQQAQQDQQRRELVKQMWKKLSGGDPLDLVA